VVGVGAATDAIGQALYYSIGQKGGANGAYIQRTHLPNYVLPESNDGSHAHTGYTDAQGSHQHGGATDQQGTHGHIVVGPKIGAGWFIAGGSATQISDNQSYPTDQQGAHNHNIATDAQGSHTHNVTTYSGGGHDHQVTLGGSGQPLTVVTMYLAVTKIIYCGPPGGSVRSLAAPAQGRFLAAPMRGSH
jgi:hypothetical protein